MKLPTSPLGILGASYSPAAHGFGSMALWHLLASDNRASPVPQPHFRPRAKNVIFIFMSGGPSHLDLFDPKPKMTACTASRCRSRPRNRHGRRVGNGHGQPCEVSAIRPERHGVFRTAPPHRHDGRRVVPHSLDVLDGQPRPASYSSVRHASVRHPRASAHGSITAWAA